jgi:hypothetical protein
MDFSFLLESVLRSLGVEPSTDGKKFDFFNLLEGVVTQGRLCFIAHSSPR